jgi:hypothetical protein
MITNEKVWQETLKQMFTIPSHRSRDKTSTYPLSTLRHYFTEHMFNQEQKVERAVPTEINNKYISLHCGGPVQNC